MSTPRSDQLHALAALILRNNSSIHSMESWVSSRGGLNLFGKEKKNSRPEQVQLVASGILIELSTPR